MYEWRGNAFYRAIEPLQALGRQGHELSLAKSDEDADLGVFRPQLLRGCDVIHGYRLLSAEELRAVRRSVTIGAAFVWDVDDDLGKLPTESPDYLDGRAARLTFDSTVEMARMADVVTASTETLADRYREEGVERIEVIGNYLPPHAIGAHRSRHDGIVVGWVAGLEHRSELSRIPVEATLERLAGVHPELRIETIGLPLDLPADRYRHIPRCSWPDLQAQMRGWDIGIAPLADIPFNHARSDVKLKEYASLGMPWVASRRGPYASLGEREGGRVVADDGWFEALDGLVRSGRDRRRLGRRASRWAKSQAIERHVRRWESVLEEAIELRAARGALV